MADISVPTEVVNEARKCLFAAGVLAEAHGKFETAAKFKAAWERLTDALPPLDGDSFVDALNPDRTVPCECCDEGVSYSTGDVCVACDGVGWREE